MKSINSFADRVLGRILATGHAQASVTTQALYQQCRNYDCGSMGCKRRCCRWCDNQGCSAYSCDACVC